jgi:hypothetical protein
MKGKKFKKFSALFITILMESSIFGLIPNTIVHASSTGVTISVTDSSNQSIPQYVNTGGIRSDTIFNSSNAVRLAAGATVNIANNSLTNVTSEKYQFVTTPQFPNDSTMTNMTIPAPNSQAAYANDLGQQGYITTKHYEYEGKADQNLSRDVSFGTPVSNGVLVQQAVSGTDIYETQGVGSNAFLLDIADNNVIYGTPNKNAAMKAMKLWGYFCPQRTGSYLLGAYSDDGAYGYITVNGVNQVFVNDWRLAGPQFRATPAGTNSDTAVNFNQNYTGINLVAGNYYPIYMEWYEGCPSQGVFVPQYLYNSSLNYNFTIPSDINSGNSNTNVMNYAIPANEFYSSKTTTPGDVSGAYFGGTSGIPFPTKDGIYYIATKFVSNEGTTSGLYGPFIIDTTPPTISNLSVVSNNSSGNKNAVPGNTLTINFTASEALQENPQILVDGYVANATYTNVSGNNYTATVNIGNDSSIDSSGDMLTQNAPINVQVTHYSDLSGNIGSPVQDNSVTFTLPPTITSITPNTGFVSGGESVVITGTNFDSKAKVTFGGTATQVTANTGTSITVTTPAVANAGAVNVVVTNGDGDAVSSTGGFTYKIPAPTITSISPNTGLTTGGNAVMITGTNFQSGCTVKVGNAAVNLMAFENSTLLRIVIPAGSAGAADVTITNPDGQSVTLVGGYTYEAVPPTITSISPNSGYVTGGDSVVITGTNFDSNPQVTFGGAEAQITASTSTSITVTTPAVTASGAVDVVETNGNGDSTTLTKGFTYKSIVPTITSISPNSGYVTGGDSVVITGTNFDANPQVTFGGTAAQITANTGTSIIVTTPAVANAGAVNVVVTDGNGNATTLTNGFTYKALLPTITSISPNTGLVSGGDSVVITGTNFDSKAQVTFGGSGAQVTANTETSITVTTPAVANAGAVNVVVTNGDGDAVTSTGGFTYKPIPLAITSISPNTGVTTGGTVATITGTNFQNGCTVEIGGAKVTTMSFGSSTSVKIVVPAGSAGAADVIVTNPDGQSATLAGGYTYTTPVPIKLPAPTITSLSPNTGLITGGVTTITGTNFQSGCTVKVGGVAVNALSFGSSTSVKIAVPAGSAGEADVTLTNPDGQSFTLAGGYTYTKPAPLPAPTITSLSPNTGLITGGVTTITGTNFQSGCTVKVGGVAVNSLSFGGSTSVKIAVPAGSAGEADVTLTNPDGQSFTLTGGYTYTTPAPLPGPTMTSISPNTGLITGGNVVTITGTNLQSGCTVKVGGVAVTTMALVSSTSLRIVVPAGSAGEANVTLTNADGQSFTLTGGYTYVPLPGPTITSLSPNTVLTTGGVTTITGTNFQSGCTVKVGGVAVNALSFGSSTSVKIAVPAGSAGAANVTLTNPDGQSFTLVGGVTYTKPVPLPGPTITSLSPNTVLTTGGVTTITGTNFQSGCTVKVGGVAVNALSYGSSTSVKIAVPAGSAGEADVTLTNPDGQSFTLVGGVTYQ